MAAIDISDTWTPSADNINALPEPLRHYIHDLETVCDPAGDVQDKFRLKTENDLLRQSCARHAIAQQLYDSEINFRIECAWDGGWVVKLGDDDNGWDAEVRIEPPLEFEDALVKLKALAIAHYPDSDFAKNITA